ncbi:MAG: phage holin family protein [Clostridia bacterium]|nr:phage holin family protein [Clostridia bacterium]
MTDLTSYIRSELFVLVPVLYALGQAFKKSPLSDWLIPYLLSAVGIALCALYLCTFMCDVRALWFASVTQGVLCAACSVYADNLIKQFARRKDGETDGEA